MLVTGEIIDEARSYHDSFTQQNHLDKLLMRRLHRAEQLLHRTVLGLAEYALARDYTITSAELLNSLQADVPIYLPAHIALLSCELRRENDTLAKVPLVTEEAGEFRYGPYAIRIVGTDLYFGIHPRTVHGSDLGTLGDDLTSLRLVYVPDPEELDDLESTLTTPDRGAPYLIGSLVQFMATRRAIPEGPGLIEAAQGMMDSAVDGFVGSQQSAHWAVTDVTR